MNNVPKSHSPHPILSQLLSWRVLAIAALAVCLFLNHLFGFFGHYGYDDMYYARLANTLIHGKFELGVDHYYYRWVIISLTAVSYKLLGISDHTSAIMPICFTLGTAWLVSKCIADRWQGLMAVFMFGLYSWTLFYADKLMPDVYVAAFFFASMYLVYTYRRDQRQLVGHAIAFAVSVFLAFLSKETIILTAPVYAYLVFIDFFHRRHRRFWFIAYGTLAVVMVLYLCLIKVETGHFLQRFYAIKQQSYFNPCSYDLLPISETIHRVTSGLLLVFTRTGMVMLLIFGLIPLTSSTFTRVFRLEEADDFFPLVFILSVLCCNFMTTSPSHYVPMCEDPRHYLFLTPIAAIMASRGLKLYLQHPNKHLWVILAVWIAFYVSMTFHLENQYTTYLPLGILCLVCTLCVYISYRPMILWTIAIGAILLAQPIQTLRYARSQGYKYQKWLIKTSLSHVSTPVRVISNQPLCEMGIYYLSFDSSHVTFRTFAQVKGTTIDSGQKVYVIYDAFTNYLSGLDWNSLPKYARETQQYKVIARQHDAVMYELPIGTILE
jgi:hypothetical protein